MFSIAPSMINSFNCLPGFSNNFMLNFSFRLPICQKPSRREKQIRDYRNADCATINAKLSTYYTTFRSSHLTRSLEDNWSLFQDRLISLADRFIILITINSSSSSPWYIKTLKRLSNKRKRLCRLAKHTLTSDNWKECDECTSIYKKALVVAKTFFTSNHLNILASKPRNFWSIAKPHPS